MVIFWERAEGCGIDLYMLLILVSVSVLFSLAMCLDDICYMANLGKELLTRLTVCSFCGVSNFTQRLQ